MSAPRLMAVSSDRAANGEEKDIEVSCKIDRPPLIPEGNYELGFVRAEEKAHLWGGRKKIFLHFQVTQAGEHFGKTLFMSATLPSNGHFSMSSKFLREWSLAAGRDPKRNDRLSTKVFRGKTFLGHVKTVKKAIQASSGKQIDRDPSTFYSVIDHLLEVQAGG